MINTMRYMEGIHVLHPLKYSFWGCSSLKVAEKNRLKIKCKLNGFSRAYSPRPIIPISYS